MLITVYLKKSGVFIHTYFRVANFLSIREERHEFVLMYQTQCSLHACMRAYNVTHYTDSSALKRHANFTYYYERHSYNYAYVNVQ